VARRSPLAFGVKRAEEQTTPPCRLGHFTAQQGEGTWQKDRRCRSTVRQDHPSRTWQTWLADADANRMQRTHRSIGSASTLVLW